MMSTELELALEQGRLALKRGESLVDVTKVLVGDEQRSTVGPRPTPKVPTPMALTDELAEALVALPAVFAQVQPGTRRTLHDEEHKALLAEREVLDKIADLLAARKKSIGELVRNHADIDAEERGLVVKETQLGVDPITNEEKVINEATPVDRSGHYVLARKGEPVRIPIPDSGKEWSLELRTGDPVINVDRLEQLERDGEIPREAYLALTREVRVFDRDKAIASLRGNHELLKVLARITEPTPPSTSLFIRRPKQK